jgi:hypothetical protein
MIIRTACLKVYQYCVAALACMMIPLSCGYKPMNGTLPKGTVAVVISVVENQTAFSSAAAPLTTALRRKAAEAGVNVESSGARAARLIVTIVKIDNEAGMLKADDKQLIPLDTIWRIEVEAQLEDAAGNIIVARQSFVASGRSLVQGSPDLEEARATDRRAAILEDIADMIVSYMFISR